MKAVYFLSVAASIVAILLTGCISLHQTQPPVEFYTLEYDPPAFQETAPLPFIIKIEPFSTSPVYDSERMALKKQKFKRDEYVYHKWRALPGEMVAAFLARDFAESGRFQAVIASESVPTYSHLLAGHVEEFFKLQENGSCRAVLAVQITLSGLMHRNLQDAVLLQKRYARSEACPDSTPAAFVEAMSRAMQRVSGQIIQDVYTSLAAHDE
ncbi:MAG: ABC-type transport auxiliary lipoprotein family protein [Deltaproteobacteria bacterium]